MTVLDICVACTDPTNGNVIWETFESSRAELESAKHEIRANPTLLNAAEQALTQYYHRALEGKPEGGPALYLPLLRAAARLARPAPDTRSVVGLMEPAPDGYPRMAVFSVNLSIRDLLQDEDQTGLTALVRQLERTMPDNAIRPSKKERLTDTIVSLLKRLDQEKSPEARRSLAAIAAAEKIVVNAGELLVDLVNHLGLPGDVRIDGMAQVALDHFRREGVVPLPFPQTVISIRTERGLSDFRQSQPSVDMVILVRDAGGSILTFQGYVRMDEGAWAGPYDFQVPMGSLALTMTRAREQGMAKGAEVILEAALVVLLACSLPNQRVPAPGERHAIAPRVAGRPVLAVKFSTVKLLPPPEPKEAAHRGPMGERRSPAYHSVRKHKRTYKSGKVIWIEAHHRGDASGLIDKIYTA